MNKICHWLSHTASGTSAKKVADSWSEGMKPEHQDAKSLSVLRG